MAQRDIFEIEIEMRSLQEEARNELNELTCKQEVQELLENLEMLEKKQFEKIEEIDDKNLKKKFKRLLEETEAATENLKQENFEEVQNYLSDIKRIIDESNIAFPDTGSGSSGVIASKALFAVENVLEYRKEGNAEEKLEGYTEELLERIESADETEVEQIINNLESENQENGFEANLEDNCRKLWNETEKARKHLNEGNFEKALDYVKEVGKILKSIEINLDHIERLEDEFDIDEDNPVAKGKVYPLKSRDDVLLKFHGSLRKSKKLKKLIDKIPDEVNITRIVEVGLYEGEAAEVIEKAPGQQIQHAENSKQLLNEIANAPQEHFNKLVNDSEVIIRYGLRPDASDNLFYSSEYGFYWIDPLVYDVVSRKEEGLDRDRFNYFRQVVPLHHPSNEKEEELARKIASKLKKADAQQSEESIDESLEEFLQKSGIEIPDWAEK